MADDQEESEPEENIKKVVSKIQSKDKVGKEELQLSSKDVGATPSKKSLKSLTKLEQKSSSQVKMAASFGGISSQMSFYESATSIGRSKTKVAGKKTVRFSNTYRLEAYNPFNAEVLSRIIKSIVDRDLDDVLDYDPIGSAKHATALASEIRLITKNLNYDRYKIFVLVYIMEDNKHGAQTAFRFLLDDKKDGFAHYTNQSKNLIISVICFGVYCE